LPGGSSPKPLAFWQEETSPVLEPRQRDSYKRDQTFFSFHFRYVKKLILKETKSRRNSVKKESGLIPWYSKRLLLSLTLYEVPKQKRYSIQEYTEITSFMKHNKAHIASSKIDHIKEYPNQNHHQSDD
jgi:hypothetical protein